MQPIEEAKKVLNELTFSHYEDFNERYGNDEIKLEKFKSKIKTDIGEILFLEVQENAFLSKDEEKQLPKEILRFKKFSEYRGINYYILKKQEEILKVFVGVFWGSAWRANNHYMQEVLEDPEIQQKTRKIQISMKDFLE